MRGVMTMRVDDLDAAHDRDDADQRAEALPVEDGHRHREQEPDREADVRDEREHARQHADRDGEPDVDDAQARRVERGEHDVRGELPAHVAAEGLVDLAARRR